MPPDTFGIEEVTGFPWIEIDFSEDVTRAKTEILPRLTD
jgi:choline kinase